MKLRVPLSRYLVFFAIALGACAADLLTKRLAFERLGPPGGETWWLWENLFGFQTSLNRGALFGMAQGLWPVFSVLSFAAAVGIVVWLFWFRAARDWLLTVALGLITAGILGNLYDRLALHGFRWHDGAPAHAVRDFIVMCQVGEWHWPNYNLADASLVCGAALLICQAFFTKPATTALESRAES
ncbi:MAG: signal peptidase II [Planctomycetaceae bacterium]|nr:signal peptidase II [Planctomycetaceae bacterium]